ncbi:hypothetical protein KIN20_011323 [Parelaphostrongylus tenuis]|uniref:Uncharacterized protein n=1 Tax=Parelaphostrongylus tenuis TaxID=148309 RepID=A0AAD5MAT4_PARTN|nr:hypothetical protein KIN20_011323 [Parelaphostrongylus tenuis]
MDPVYQLGRIGDGCGLYQTTPFSTLKTAVKDLNPFGSRRQDRNGPYLISLTAAEGVPTS